MDTAQWDAELAALVDVENATPFELGEMRILEHTPEIAKGMAIRYEHAVADGVSNDLVCALENPPDFDENLPDHLDQKPKGNFAPWGGDSIDFS